jgi:flagellar assembly factor FliW
MKEKIIKMQNGVLRREQIKKNPLLKRGDRVYVLTKNFGTKRSTKKLDYVKVGPFLIKEQTGPVNYRVQLPSNTRKH